MRSDDHENPNWFEDDSIRASDGFRVEGYEVIMSHDENPNSLNILPSELVM
jgi:hypothetical protein